MLQGQSLLLVRLDLDQSDGQLHSNDTIEDSIYIDIPRTWRFLPPFFLGKVLLYFIFVLASSVLHIALGARVGLPQFRFVLFCAHPVGVFFAID